MYLPGFDRPVFITRVLNNEFKYLTNFSEFDGIIMDANLANHYSKPWAKVLEKRDKRKINFIMVDPNTAKLEYKQCVQKITYQKLSYCPENEGLTPDDFSDIDFTEEFTDNVIYTQVDLGADLLLTPYFVAKTIKSPWYHTNLRLAQRAIDRVEKSNIEQPLYATICISISEIMSSDSRNKIVQDYRNLNVNGYYILAEGLHDRTSGKEELAALLSFIEDLRQFKKPVLLGFIDGFGVIATSFGIAGFSAGICWLESFNEDNFTLILEGRNEDAMRERFIYIPEVFMKFPRDRAQLIYGSIKGLTSNKKSLYFNDKTINWNDRARYIFLEHRFKELKVLSGLGREQILIQIEKRLDNAIRIAEKIYEEDIHIQRAHLTRWKEALTIAKSN